MDHTEQNEEMKQQKDTGARSHTPEPHLKNTIIQEQEVLTGIETLPVRDSNGELQPSGNIESKRAEDEIKKDEEEPCLKESDRAEANLQSDHEQLLESDLDVAENGQKDQINNEDDDKEAVKGSTEEVTAESEKEDQIKDSFTQEVKRNWKDASEEGQQKVDQKRACKQTEEGTTGGDQLQEDSGEKEKSQSDTEKSEEELGKETRQPLKEQELVICEEVSDQIRDDSETPDSIIVKELAIEDESGSHCPLPWPTAKCVEIMKSEEWPSSVAIVKLCCPCKETSGADLTTEIRWRCFVCLQFLVHDFAGYFYCNCGKGQVENYAYMCGDSAHGTQYLKSTNSGLCQRLNQLPEAKEISILLLGESGVGKSTWVNALLNYITFRTLDEAMEYKSLLYRIPIYFTFYRLDEGENSEYQQVVVSFSSDGNEKYVPGQSSTQVSCSYRFPYEDHVIHIIDTPGMGDTRGSVKEDANFKNILDTLFNLPSIHGICMLLNPNARLNVTLRRCISDVFKHVDKVSSKNIVFCFTHTRSTFYKPGDTYSSLKALLKELGLVDLVKPDTTYCVDNEAFRFLALEKDSAACSGSDKANVRYSWEVSSNEMQRMLDHFVKIEPHQIPKKEMQSHIAEVKTVKSSDHREQEKVPTSNISGSAQENDRIRDALNVQKTEIHSPDNKLAVKKKNKVHNSMFTAANTKEYKGIKESSNGKAFFSVDEGKAMNKLLRMNVHLCEELARVEIKDTIPKNDEDRQTKSSSSCLKDDLAYLMQKCAQVSALIMDKTLTFDYTSQLLKKTENLVKMNPNINKYVHESIEIYQKNFDIIMKNESDLQILKEKTSIERLVEEAYKVVQLTIKQGTGASRDPKKTNPAVEEPPKVPSNIERTPNIRGALPDKEKNVPVSINKKKRHAYQPPTSLPPANPQSDSVPAATDQATTSQSPCIQPSASSSESAPPEYEKNLLPHPGLFAGSPKLSKSIRNKVTSGARKVYQLASDQVKKY